MNPYPTLRPEPQDEFTLSSPAQPAKLNIAVIGAGLIGRVHAEQINAHPDCQLCALADPSPQGQALAEAYQLPRLASLDAVLAAGHCDGIILATPNHLHVSQALQCLAAKIPTLIEKPVAHTLAEGQRLLAAARHSDVPLLVGHHRMHSPLMQQAKAIIEAGELGELVAVSGSALFYKPADYFAAGPWRTQPGGGPVLINMIHEIGNLRYLCGEITAVQATASNKRRGFAVEDTVGIVLTFANGTLATFVLSDTAASTRSWEQTAQENPAYAYDNTEDCYHITGTQGSLSVPTMQLKRFPTQEERSWYQPLTHSQAAVQRKDPLTQQLSHFCQVIQRQVAPLVSVHDGLQNLRVTEAIVAAAASGTVIRFDTDFSSD